MTIGELAAFVCTYLKENGIDVVLSGGACVSIYTKNKYQSYDLDFIENILTSRKKIKEVLQRIGFIEEHRYFKHPDTKIFLEFPPGPLSIGDEPVRGTIEKEFSTGLLRLISGMTDKASIRQSSWRSHATLILARSIDGP